MKTILAHNGMLCSNTSIGLGNKSIVRRLAQYSCFDLHMAICHYVNYSAFIKAIFNIAFSMTSQEFELFLGRRKECINVSEGATVACETPKTLP